MSLNIQFAGYPVFDIQYLAGYRILNRISGPSLIMNDRNRSIFHLNKVYFDIGKKEHFTGNLCETFYLRTGIVLFNVDYVMV